MGWGIFFGAEFGNNITVDVENFDRAGDFFRGWIRKHWEILHNGWGARIGPGDFFFCAGFGNIGKSLQNSGWWNLGPGGTSFEAGFGNRGKSFRMLGEIWIGQGDVFSPEPST